jgi:thymidylate kinase
MLDIAKDIFNLFNKSKISYCHWKSNIGLIDELDGGELDLYVKKSDKENLESLLKEYKFIKITDPLQLHIKNVFHFYGLDHKTGKILHLHIFYSIVTGESILKNYDFGNLDFLFNQVNQINNIPIPLKKNEFPIFLIRLAAKHSSILEYFLLKRDYNKVLEELNYFSADNNSNNYSLREKLNFNLLLDENKFDMIEKFYHSIINKKPYIVKYLYARKINSYFKSYNRFNPFKRMLLRNILFFTLGFRKIFKMKKTKKLINKGFVLAFTGPEATGKSTLVDSTTNWLNSNFCVYNFHMGKPKSSIITFPINIFSPFFKMVFSKQRNINYIKNNISNGESKFVYSIKSLVLAIDRYSRAKKVFNLAMKGAVVICDRWPSSEVGKMDSSRIVVSSKSSIKSKFLRLLSKIENKIYEKIKSPDFIIKLSVSPDVAVSRNINRRKRNKETSNYVIQRHKKSMMPKFIKIKSKTINTDKPLSDTIIDIKNIIWNEIILKNEHEL